MCKCSIFNKKFSLFLQLYIAEVPIESGYGCGSSGNFPAPDPTKKVRIRIRNPEHICTRKSKNLSLCVV